MKGFKSIKFAFANLHVNLIFFKIAPLLLNVECKVRCIYFILRANSTDHLIPRWLGTESTMSKHKIYLTENFEIIRQCVKL